MSRPRGSIRLALATSAFEIASSSPLGGATWREAAAAAQVGFGVACRTWHDMRRAGELVDVQSVSAGHSCRPMVLCRPAEVAVALSPGDALLDAMRSWAAFR